MQRSAADLLGKMTWHDDHHLQIGETHFLLTFDLSILTTTESTSEQFLLLKDPWLLKRTLDFLPEPIDNMIEFGILKGGSIALYDGVSLYYGTDQGDRQALKSIIRENFSNQSLDLVIDDGSHRYEPTKTALNLFLPLLRPGGVYLFEDWGWAHERGQEFQNYADQKEPLSKLLFEAIMLAASRPSIIREVVVVSSSLAVLVRGDEVITDENFEIGEAFMTGFWRLKFSPRNTSAALRLLWRREIPLSIRRRIPPELAAWLRDHLPR